MGTAINIRSAWSSARRENSAVVQALIDNLIAVSSTPSYAAQ
jgi:hypothetical protein